MRLNHFSRSMLLAATTLLFCFCGGGKKGGEATGEALEFLPEPYTIAFDVDKLSTNDAPAMSDVIDSLEYIKLEFHPDYPIASILRCPYVDDNYIVIYTSQGLLQYTRGGKFVRKVGSTGRGPGEYLQIRGYWVDSEAGIVYTMPNYETSVDRYDLATGKYLGETEITDADGKPQSLGVLLPLSGSTMVAPNNLSAVSHGMPPPHYFFSAIDLLSARIIHREVSKTYPASGKSNVGSTGYWYDDRGRLNLKESINNTAYVINPDFTMTPKVTFDLGGAMLDLKDLQTFNLDHILRKMLIGSIMETGRYVYVELTYDGNYYAIVFDKTSGESRLLGKEPLTITEEGGNRSPFLGFRNDVDGGYAFPSGNSFCSYDKDIWFASYYAYKMIETLTPEHFASVRSTVKYPDRLDKLQKFVGSLTEDDNPVIVIAHLK